MGLVALLSVSKTLRVAKDVPHRYRKTGLRLLPTFGPAERGQSRKSAMKTELKRELRNEPEETTEESRPSAKDATGGTGATPSASRPGAADGARPARRWVNLGRWFSLERWGLRRPAPAKRFGGQSLEPVQQELALGAIKPCRNDLSDADWELAKPQSASGAKLVFLKSLANGDSPRPRGAQAAASGATADRI
jgi:hypothetical protein